MSTSKKDNFERCKNRHELAGLLEIDEKTLRFFSYNKTVKYKKFYINKSNGGQREILAPKKPLKSVQRSLAEILNTIYPAPAASYGFVKGRDIVKNSRPHLDKYAVLNIDLENFFPSITSGRLIAFFRKHFQFNDEVTSALVGLVCFENKLPQGAPTSPVISNMICFRLDRELGRFAKKNGASYTRYADDITFSTRSKKFSEEILKSKGKEKLSLGVELVKIIESNYFSINPQKTRVAYGKDPKYVTGVKVNEKPNVSKKYTRQIRAMLYAWEEHGPIDAAKDFKEKYGGGDRNFQEVVRGKIAHLKNVKGHRDALYSRLYNKFVELEGKGRPRIPENKEQEIANSVFVIRAGEQGSGFILDKKYLVTCAHVIKDNEVAYFTTGDCADPTQKKSQKRSWLIDETSDLAFFELKDEKFINEHSLESLRVGDEVLRGATYQAVGFPSYQSYLQPRFTPITVTGLEKNKHAVLHAIVTGPLLSGNSGGPVLNEKDEIVGIVALGAPDSAAASKDWFGYSFIPISEVRERLSNLLKAK